ncbi:MAG TPA: hypothetical protein PKM43_20225 [Verrucomicrobiota bacterium]|nr:hypothetical protein [Verrucomicrobiota bacterium]
MTLPDISHLFDTLELPQPFQSGRTPARVKTGWIQAKPRDNASHNDVLAEIEKFAQGKAEGWTCFAQELHVGISNTRLPRDKGLLLNAEFVQRTADGTDPVSLHVRHLGSHWRLTELTSGTEPQRGFLVPHRFLSSRQPANRPAGPWSLDYEVLWESPDDSQPFRAILSRFTGFSTENKQPRHA